MEHHSYWWVARRTGVCVVIAISVLWFGIENASATTCDAYSYVYAGQDTPSQNWDGVVGYISNDSFTLPAGTADSHEVNYLDVNDNTHDCHAAATC